MVIMGGVALELEVDGVRNARFPAAHTWLEQELKDSRFQSVRGEGSGV